MNNMFQIVSESTVTSLKLNLYDMFTYQEALDKCGKALLIDPPDTSLLAEQEAATILTTVSIQNLATHQDN